MPADACKATESRSSGRVLTDGGLVFEMGPCCTLLLCSPQHIQNFNLANRLGGGVPEGAERCLLERWNSRYLK